MSDGQEQEFDIDAGVDSIASDMGWNDESDNDDDESGIVDEHNEPDEEEVSEETEEESTEPTSKAPPASWSKDQHENWGKVPKEAQDYIELREKQMLDGIEQYKEGNTYAGEIQKIVEPFRDMLDQHGVDEKTAISNLFSWNKTLQSGTLEQRQQAFIALGNDLGIIPKEGQAAIDPNTKSLQERLDRIERQETQRTQSAQKENYNRIAQEVNEFAKDKDDFDLLGDDITLILKSGVDLPTAYEKARWANPVTRAKALAESVAEQTKVISKKNSEAAKAALKAKSTNVRNVNTNKTQKEATGSWDDTMAETLAKIKSH